MSKQAAPPPTPNPLGIEPVLNSEEAATLAQAGFKPEEFCVLTQSPSGMQVVGPFMLQNGQQCYGLIVQMALPTGVVDLPVSRLVSKDGQGIASQALQKALVGATVRLIVRQDVLTEGARKAVASALAKKQAQELISGGIGSWRTAPGNDEVPS